MSNNPEPLIYLMMSSVRMDDFLRCNTRITAYTFYQGKRRQVHLVMPDEMTANSERLADLSRDLINTLRGRIGV